MASLKSNQGKKNLFMGKYDNIAFRRWKESKNECLPSEDELLYKISSRL